MLKYETKQSDEILRTLQVSDREEKMAATSFAAQRSLI